MNTQDILFLLALLLPLSIDAFVLSAALGMAGMPKKDQLRTSGVLATFEGGMPLIGALLGHGVGSSIGNVGGYAAGIVIGIAGIFMLLPQTEDKEEKNLRLLSHAKGWSMISLGLSISIDGLAVGFSLGLLKVSLLFIVCYVAIQTFIAARIGLWLGGRLNDRFRNNAERFGGIILVLVALLLIISKVNGHNL